MPYHCVLLGPNDSLECLVAFLNNENTFPKDMRQEGYVAENTKMLARLTGIKEFSKIKSIRKKISRDIQRVVELLSTGSITKAQADEEISELTARLAKMVETLGDFDF